jgi:TnpA family transposase
MSGASPHFQPSYTHEELVEHCLLTPADLQLVLACRGEANRCGMALLLKALPYLGYVPDGLAQIPGEVRTFVAGQLGLLWDHSEHYPWPSRTWDQHVFLIRQHTGWRFPTAQDKADLEAWLRREAAFEAHSAEDLWECACQRLRHLQVELPAEGELQRLVNAALNGFFQDIHHRIAEAMPPEVRHRTDQLLVVPDARVVSGFEHLKADPGKPGVNNLHAEIEKLRTIRAVRLTTEPFVGIPWKVLQLLKRRAAHEKASEMREHPEGIRYALLGCFLHVRAMEVTDDVTRMAVELIHRLDTRSEKQIQRELLADLERVEGKMQILSRVAEAVVEYPDGIVREVIFPQVKEETFRNLVAEFRHSGPHLRLLRQTLMQRKFARHYRRMLPALLQTLPFRSDNRFRPIIDALALIQRYVGSHHTYFPEVVPIPLEGVVAPKWQEKVLEQVKGEARVNRHYYELCVLEKLERALKCKEVWVEGSYAFRNPSEDMPHDWSDEQRRALHYRDLGTPLDAQRFVDALKARLTTALAAFNRVLPRLSHIRIFRPRTQEARGLWALTKLEPQPEPQSLGLLKDAIRRRYGMLDLLDVLVEADSLVGFTRFFTHSGTKEVRSREVLRPLLLLDVFAEGTNMGIRRVANANDQYSYDELLYVRKTYCSPEALRNANGAVVNKLLALRNPRLWGEGASSCASDATRFESWQQNLMTEWRSRYRGYGVMVYWHVETNAVCIYSQVKSFSSSEIAAMIEGLIRHDTEMRVEKNFVDSHGHSEVAFAFCHLLGMVRRMPRLKRLKYERLYLPGKGTADAYPNLAGTFARAIRREPVQQQYDEMVKAAVALKRGTATAEAILKRDNSYNVTHPTYKALAEVGKAEKTIFLCEYLASRETQREVHDGLNVVENWNATNDFICYGRQGELATNSREQQEIVTLSLQLLQNCLMLINTLLLEHTIEREGLWECLSAEDRRALTPLFHGHINPYGQFTLDLARPSFLEVA